MTAVAHIICCNEQEIISYTIRHYLTFCQRVIVHDLGSKDQTLEICKKLGVEVISHDSGGVFDDGVNKKIKNEAWKSTEADWIIVADADEFIYFPAGAEITLKAYAGTMVSVVKPYGYEMLSDAYPTTEGQIYDEVKFGAPDNIWYSKPILFSPKRVASMDYAPGAHWGRMSLKNGRTITVDNNTPPTRPECYMLHFHQIGPAERLAERYDAALARQSPANLKNGWGNRTPGAKHVQEKREFIKKDLQRIIP